jgi:hypothetical protein
LRPAASPPTSPASSLLTKVPSSKVASSTIILDTPLVRLDCFRVGSNLGSCSRLILLRPLTLLGVFPSRTFGHGWVSTQLDQLDLHHSFHC